MNATPEQQKQKQRRYTLAAFQILIGIGAVAGGLGMVMDPSGTSMGISISMLDPTPFPDFLVPGLVLLAVNGLGSLVGAFLTLRRFRYTSAIAMALGAFLMAWITIQVWWIRDQHWLHPFYFMLGLAELWLGSKMQRPPIATGS